MQIKQRLPFWELTNAHGVYIRMIHGFFFFTFFASVLTSLYDRFNDAIKQEKNIKVMDPPHYAKQSMCGPQADFDISSDFPTFLRSS